MKQPITKKQLKKYFEWTASFGEEGKEYNGQEYVPLDGYEVVCIDRYDVKVLIDGYEVVCNDRYDVKFLNIYKNGKMEIHCGTCEEDARMLEVSKGAKFKFYKVTREEVK